jgi:hypothetical protein
MKNKGFTKEMVGNTIAIISGDDKITYHKIKERKDVTN